MRKQRGKQRGKRGSAESAQATKRETESAESSAESAQATKRETESAESSAESAQATKRETESAESSAESAAARKAARKARESAAARNTARSKTADLSLQIEGQKTSRSKVARAPSAWWAGDRVLGSGCILVWHFCWASSRIWGCALVLSRNYQRISLHLLSRKHASPQVGLNTCVPHMLH